MSRKEFDKEMEKLQVELVKMQQWVIATGAKVCVLFEGRDTAGKGGVIKRITERTSPRVFRHVALPAPTEREKSQMYFQRYMPYLPAAGEVVLFDRSWYNRAGVERVMGFATPGTGGKFPEICASCREGPSSIPASSWSSTGWKWTWTFRMSGCGRATKTRARSGSSRPMDMRSYSHWYDYSRARDAMFAATDTPESPWYVVKANNKRQARLNLITHFLSQVPYEEVPREPIKFPKRQAKG